MFQSRNVSSETKSRIRHTAKKSNISKTQVIYISRRSGNCQFSLRWAL